MKFSLKKKPPSQLQKTLNEVNVLFSRGNINASEKILNELAASFPSHPEVLSKLGTIYLYQDKLNDGIQLIKKSLEANPYQPDVLNNFSVALLNSGQPQEALVAIQKSIQLKPDYIDAYYHQGLIYKSLGLYGDALKAYQKTIQLKPSHENAAINSAAIYIQLEKYNDAISILNSIQLSQPSLGYFYNLGLAQLKLEHFIEADQLFHHVTNQDPNYSEAWNNLGLALKGLERFEDALHCIEKAILLNNKYTKAYDNKGLVLIELERFEEALVVFQIALKLTPDDHEIYNNTGIAHMGLKQFNEAITHYNLSLKFNPKYVKAFNNRGLAYQELLRFDEALNDFNRAIQIKDDYAEAINNRGLLYKDQRLFDKAILDLEFAFKLNPNLLEINFNLSMIYLLQLNFKEGWKNYEKRKNVSEYLKKTELSNKIYLTEIPKDHEPILLHSEQGIGDQIIFLSLLNEVIKLPNPILVQLEPRLISLLKRSFPAINFYSDKKKLCPSLYKYHALVGSLPQFFRNSKESFAIQKNYFLKADQHKSSTLKNRLSVNDHFICGISWKSSNEKIGNFKTASLNDFLPILKLPFIHFLDLQYGDTDEERSLFKNEFNISITKVDDIDNFNDIDGLASLIDACDFIVTISNVTAHIAGALGKKVYLMVPFDEGKIWYWHDALNISLWYPSIQIFRQTKAGDWSEPINEIKEKIEEEISHE
jgi:tetratricopeptide (TPR) repeat protein